MSNLDAVVRSVLTVAQALQADFDRVAAAAGLTTQGASVLLEIGAGGALKMQELAHRLACDAGNLSGTVDRLEAARLVERVVHPSDRRARLLRLTARGRKTAGRLFEAVGATDVHRRVEAMAAGDRERLVALLGALGSDADGAPVAVPRRRSG